MKEYGGIEIYHCDAAEQRLHAARRLEPPGQAHLLPHTRPPQAAVIQVRVIRLGCHPTRPIPAPGLRVRHR